MLEVSQPMSCQSGKVVGENSSKLDSSSGKGWGSSISCFNFTPEGLGEHSKLTTYKRPVAWPTNYTKEVTIKMTRAKMEVVNQNRSFMHCSPITKLSLEENKPLHQLLLSMVNYCPRPKKKVVFCRQYDDANKLYLDPISNGQDKPISRT